MKLLLAEDTKTLNRAVCVLLQEEGYEVDCAFDGEEALTFLFGSGYDGVILDIMMPKRDGLSVLSEIRRRHILTPVLLLTAKGEVDDRVAGLDAGADDYLSKPFAVKELLARVRSMVRRRTEYEPTEFCYGDFVLRAKDMTLTARNAVRLCVKEFVLQLVAENPKYKPLVYQNEDLDHIRILGKAVYFMSAVDLKLPQLLRS